MPIIVFPNLIHQPRLTTAIICDIRAILQNTKVLIDRINSGIRP